MARPVRLVFLADDSSLTRALSRLVTQTSATQAALRRLEKTGADMHRIGRSMTVGFTLPVVAAATAAAVLSTRYEATMMKIQTLAGASAAQVSGWSKQLLALGPALGKTPQELAEALYYIVSSGAKASDALDILTASAKASTVGLGDTQTVADAVTSAMNAYGSSNLSAARATDILLRAVKDGKGEASDLAHSIGLVIPIAAQLHVSFADVAAGMAAITQTGSTAAEASTQLRNVMNDFIKPSEQVQKALKGIGLSAEDVRKSLANKGLLPTLQMLKEKVGSNTEVFGKLFPNIRGLLGVLSLVGPNGEKVAGVFKDVAAAGGDVNAAFALTKTTTLAKFHEALASLSAAGIQVGAVFAPSLAKVALYVAHLAEAFAKMDPEQRKTLLTVIALVAAIGPLLFGLGGLVKVFAMAARNPLLTVLLLLTVAFITAYTRNEKFREGVQRAVAKLIEFGHWIKQNSTWILAAAGALTTFFTVAMAFSALSRTFGVLVIIKNSFMVLALFLKGGFTNALTVAKTAWASFNATFFASPWGIAIAALLAIGIAFFIAYKKSATFRAFVQKVFHAVADASKVAWKWIVEGSKTVYNWLKGPLTTVFRLWWTAVKWYFGTIWKILQPPIQFFKTFAKIVGEAFSNVSGAVRKHWNVIKIVLIALAAIILTPLIPLVLFVLAMRKWGKQIWSILTLVFHIWWTVCKGFWTAVFTVFSAIASFLAPIFSIYVKIVSFGLKVMWAIISSVFKLIWEIIKAVINVIWVEWQGFWAALSVVLRVWWVVVSTIIGVAYRSIVAIFSAIWHVVGPYVTVFWENVKRGFKIMVDAITTVLTAVWNTISSVWNKVSGFVGPIVGKIVDAVVTAFHRMRDGVSGAFGGISGVVKTAINEVIRKINSIHIPPVKIAGTTVFDGWGGPNVPYLAQGAIVNSPTLAMIGEAGAELVLPLTRKDRALQLLRQSGLLGDIGRPAGGASGAPASSAAAPRAGKTVNIENINVYGSNATARDIGGEITWQVRAALL